MRLLAILMITLSGVAVAAEAELPLRVQSALNTRNVPHDTLSIFVADVATGESVLEGREEACRSS